MPSRANADELATSVSHVQTRRRHQQSKANIRRRGPLGLRQQGSLAPDSDDNEGRIRLLTEKLEDVKRLPGQSKYAKHRKATLTKALELLQAHRFHHTAEQARVHTSS